MEPNPLLKLNLGCGAHRLPNWRNHDRDVDLSKPLPWRDHAAGFILLEHVLEHFDSREAFALLEECWRVLAPGGVVRICVPDVTQVEHDMVYNDFITQRSLSSSGVKAIACNYGHKMLWHADTLAVVLRTVGFVTEKASPRVSRHPELCEVEGHHKVVGTRINDAETLVIEGTRPPG